MMCDAPASTGAFTLTNGACKVVASPTILAGHVTAMTCGEGPYIRP